MGVIIYSQPNCQTCRMTKERLTANGITFEEGSIDKHRELFRSMGFTSAPVVLVEQDTGPALSWAGYRHDFISALIAGKPEGFEINGYTRMKVMIKLAEQDDDQSLN